MRFPRERDDVESARFARERNEAEMDDEARIRKYELEIERLDQLHAELEELWTKMPRYGYLALLAPVIWYFAGFGWAVVELLVTAALVGTQAYLIGLRKSENRWNRATLLEDIRRLRAEQDSSGSPALSSAADREPSAPREREPSSTFR